MSALEQDDAPELTEAVAAGAQIAVGGEVVREASGTLSVIEKAHRRHAHLDRLAAQDERDAIVAFIRQRGGSALEISKRSTDRLPMVEAERLKRWFDALADDIDAELHGPDDE